jgi:hypothetical protein
MAKRELKCGYQPLRPSERLFAYVSFIVLVGLTGYQARFEGVTMGLVLYTAALLFAISCAFIALVDARVTARLRRRELLQQRQEATSQHLMVAEKSEPRFLNATGDWMYFNDPSPTRS